MSRFTRFGTVRIKNRQNAIIAFRKRSKVFFVVFSYKKKKKVNLTKLVDVVPVMPRNRKLSDSLLWK